MVVVFGGLKVSEMREVEKCPHPWEPLSGTPTAQIGMGNDCPMGSLQCPVRLMHISKVRGIKSDL